MNGYQRNLLLLLLFVVVFNAVEGCYDPKNPPKIPNAICKPESVNEKEAFTSWSCGCTEGYSLQYSQEYIVICYANNKTSTSLPVCLKSCTVTAPRPGRWVNVEVGTVILSGDSVVERCSQPPPGMKQLRILICRDGMWSSIWLSDSCSLELCDPTPILAGSYSRCYQSGKNNSIIRLIGSTRTSQCFEGSKAIYRCTNRYKPSIPDHYEAFAECRYGGKWSPIMPNNFRCEFNTANKHLVSKENPLLIVLNAYVLSRIILYRF